MDLSQLSDEQLNQLEAQIRQQQAAPPRIDLSSLSNEQLDELEKKVRGDTVGTAEAVGRGAAQGLSFGFGDEMRGILAAGGLEKGQPGSLYGLVKGLAKYWGGDEEAARRYVETVTEERRRTQLAEQQHPTASTLGELGGALLIPGIGEVGAGGNLAVRAARAGKTGALWGALSGAGEGEDLQSRLTGAAGGAVLGGIGGAVLSPAIEYGAALARKPIRELEQWINPKAAAERMMANAAARAEKLEPYTPGTGQPLPANRLTPQELAQNPDARLIDLLGQPGRSLARAAANVSPEAQSNLERLVNDRFAGQGDRVLSHMNQMFHYPNPEATQAALDEVARTTNRGNYMRAYSAGDRPLMTPDMQDMVLRAPAMRDAIRDAIPQVQNRAVAMGMGARNPGIRFENGLPVFDRGAPNLQFWDTVKRELDSIASQAARKGDSNASTYGALATKLRTELDAQVPIYKDARQGAAKFFGAENASDAGVQFFNNKMTPEQGRQALARFSPMERQLFEDSFTKQYMDNIAKRGDRTNVLNQIAGSPLAREKLNIAIGRDRANQLEALVRSESIMDRARGAVVGGSNTIRQWATIMGLGGAAGYFEGENPRDVSFGALLGAATKMGRARLNERVMERLGELMSSRDTAAFARGHAAFAKSEARMNVLRNLDNLTAKAVGSQIGSRL